jgi:CheY-like chemotaxis protein
VILLVEDDDDIRAVIVEVLHDAGFDVISAANGREALEKLAQLQPWELIVLDLMMPVMNGWEFRRAQLADERIRDVPVLLMSGVADAREAQRGLGSAGVLRKPFTVDDLVDAVARERAT